MAGTAGPSAEVTLRLATASLIGLAVGLEREWSGHAAGPHGRFAGLRTFFLLGLLGGAGGVLIAGAHEGAGVALLVAGGALSVAAYAGAVRRDNTDLDGTTEVAAVVVLALGVLAVLGDPVVAAGAGAVVVLMLGEKARLHWLIGRISEEELEAALQFAVLALVVLPLLPPGPYGGVLDIRPQTVWAVVLLFSGLNFIGYVARRIVGAGRGYGITGLLGGLVSSTAVTLQFSQHSRRTPALGAALGRGVIGACTALLPRVVVLSAFINPAVSVALVPRVLFPAVVGAALFLFASSGQAPETPRDPRDHESPLGLLASIRMAVAFQIAMSVIAVVHRGWGTPGLYASAAVLGLTDVDALTVSMGRSGAAAHVGAQAIGIGILANTVLKLAVGVTLGSPALRRLVGPGLLALAVGSVLGLWLLWDMSWSV